MDEKASLGITKIIPEVYDDALSPAAQETGKTIALLPKAINAALSPVRKWIATREYNVAETEKLLQKKLEKVGAEHVVPPEPYVAVPALQAISYTMSSDDLRNLYANLLARSMTDTVKDKVHPSFAEIIKQLSPDEAKLIHYFIDINSIPLIDVKCLFPPAGRTFSIRLHNFTCIAENICDNYDSISVAGYIDNLCRLKIVDIPEYQWFADDAVYEELKGNRVVMDIMNTKLPENQSWNIEKKKLDVTAFGRKFIDICVKDL